RVAADRHHLPSLRLDLETARGFAEWTGPVVRGHLGTLLGGIAELDPQGARRAREEAIGVVERRGAPVLAAVLTERPREDRVRVPPPGGGTRAPAQARQHHCRPLSEGGDRRTGGAIERSPDELGPHVAVSVVAPVARRPGGAE